MQQPYRIRAEFPDKTFFDFDVTAEDLTTARKRAVERICEKYGLDAWATVFDWRGQVVFVDQGFGKAMTEEDDDLLSLIEEVEEPNFVELNPLDNYSFYTINE